MAAVLDGYICMRQIYIKEEVRAFERGPTSFILSSLLSKFSMARSVSQIRIFTTDRFQQFFFH